MHFDEEKFTAYALGELDSADVGPIEARLGYDDAARRFVDEVRAAAGLLTQSLQQELTQRLSDSAHAAIDRQLRANRAASTGLTAAGAPAGEAEQPATATMKIAGSAPAPAHSPSPSTERRVAPPAGKRESIFSLRARRYDRAVLALSLAASVAIVCLAMAALLLVLKDRHPIATVTPSSHGDEAPYYLPNRPTPPLQPEPTNPSFAQAPVAPTPHQPGLTTDELAPWLSQLTGHQTPQWTEPAATADVRVPHVIEQPAGSPADGLAGPVTTIHVARAGLVRGPADMPRSETAAAPKMISPGGTSAGTAYSSINPASGAPLTLTDPTKLDPSLDLSRFETYAENPLVSVATQPFSTFAPITDSASYVLTRRFISHGYFPPPQAVRVEEMLNYFQWNTPAPTNPDAAFATSIEVAACPWNVNHRLARISLKAREVSPAHRPAVNLVVLVDLSARMAADNKLPLLKKSLKLLLGQLGPRDRLSIVGASQTTGVFLPPTPANDHPTILNAIDRLSARGVTGSAPGIETAYYAAAAAFVPSGVNRVLLATDGSWSAGLTDPAAITDMIRDKARNQNVSLGVLAMGGASAKTEAALRRLAAAGNGSYLPIDDLAEARRTLVDQADGSLVEVARDVSVRVEFEPATTESYRLIGYESHLLPAADFDDAVVGGASIGAGHDTTALYEIIPTAASRPATAPAAALLTVSVHYVDPATQSPSLLKFAGSDRPIAPSKVSNDFKFAAAIAEFAMLLRDTPHGAATWSTVVDLAQQGRGPDEAGYRQQFVELARRAKTIAARG